VGCSQGMGVMANSLPPPPPPPSPPTPRSKMALLKVAVASRMARLFRAAAASLRSTYGAPEMGGVGSSPGPLEEEKEAVEEAMLPRLLPPPLTPPPAAARPVGRSPRRSSAPGAECAAGA